MLTLPTINPFTHAIAGLGGLATELATASHRPASLSDRVSSLTAQASGDLRWGVSLLPSTDESDFIAGQLTADANRIEALAVPGVRATEWRATIDQALQHAAIGESLLQAAR